MRSMILVSLSLLAACSDTAVTKYNSDPDVLIASHVDGDTVLEGATETILGQVGDPNHAIEDLSVTWLLDGTATCEDSTPDEAGLVLCNMTFDIDSGDIALTVRDPEGAGATARVTLDVQADEPPTPPNSPPTCAITGPASGSVGAEGELVTFTGTADDLDVTPDSLDVAWSSDKDGPIGSSTPTSSGEITFPYSDLSVNTHVVTMTVTDELGETCTTDTVFTVGTSPVLTITAPSDGAVLDHGAAVVFEATVSDNEDLPNEVALIWESDIDAVFSTVGADSSGAVTVSVGSLSAGDQVVTVTATDTDGLFVTDTVSFSLRTPPTTPTVTIEPDPATTNQTLVATASGSEDPEDPGTVTYAYQWFEDGVLSAESSATTFPASATGKHHTYRVQVNASDGLVESAFGFAEVDVINSEPELSGPTLSAATVVEGDVLTCTATATDIDPEDSPTVTYAWSDGSTGSTYTVSTTDAVDSTITCTATADDADGGTATGTASATVINNRPDVSDIVLSPSELFTNDTLTAIPTVSDADGDELTVTYAFSVNGEVVQDGTSDSLSGVEYFDKGDGVSVIVTADDGVGFDTRASETLTVLNTPPTAPTVSIQAEACPSDWTLLGDEERCVAVFEGPDHTWPEAEAECNDMGGHLARVANEEDNDTLYALATDIPDESIWVGYNERDIEGTWAWSDGGPTGYENWREDEPGGGFPSTDEDCVALLHNHFTVEYAGHWVDEDCETAGWVGGYACQIPTEGGDLVCSIDEESTDEDGDTVTYTFDWDVDGTPFSDTETTLHDGDTVPGDALGADETWTCEVTPDDSDDDGDMGTASHYIEDVVEALVIPDSDMSFDVLSVPGTLLDHDVAADGSTRVLTNVDGTLYLHCFAPDGIDELGAIEIGSAGTTSTQSFAVFTSRVSKHTMVAWRWYSPTHEEFRYSYLDADCSMLVPETLIWTGDYVEFFDVALDDYGRGVVAYGQGGTHVAWIDSDGSILGTETPFDIGAGNGTHVAMNSSTGAGIVASQVHSGDGIYYQRFNADFEWVDPSPVHMPAGYHYWYDGFTVGMNDNGQFAFLWVSGISTIEMAFYSADGDRVTHVVRGMPDYGGWDVFRRRHSEIPLHGDNFIFGEVYNYSFGAGTTVNHFEYTPEGDLVSVDSTTHSVNEGLTIRTDGWGNAVVRDASTVLAKYSYP
jgi:hypothetical protein